MHANPQINLFVSTWTLEKSYIWLYKLLNFYVERNQISSVFASLMIVMNLKKASFALKVASGQTSYVNFSTFGAHERPCFHCVALRYDITSVACHPISPRLFNILERYAGQAYKCRANETWQSNTVFTRFRSRRTGNDYWRNFGASGLITVKFREQHQRNEIYQLYLTFQENPQRWSMSLDPYVI